MTLRTLRSMGILAGALALAILLGCGGAKKDGALQGPGSDKQGPAPGGPDASGETFLIGAVLEKSGQLQNWGRQSEAGMKLALEETNGQDGVRIELFVEDNKSTPDQSANAFIGLVNVKNVLAVLGAVASSNTRAMKEQANKLGVPLVTHASTNVQLTKDSDWLYRICWNDSFQGAVCANFAKDHLKATKAVVVTDSAQDYSRGLTRNFQETFEGTGGKVIQELTYQSGDKVFTSQVEKLKALDPEVVFCSGYSAEVALLLKTAREAGVQRPFLGGDGLDDPQFFSIAGPHAGTGVFLCNHAHQDDPAPKVQRFVKAYKEKFGEDPGAMSFLGYDVLLAIRDALKRAKAKGAVTRASLRDAVASIKDLELVTGSITVGADHEVKKRAVVTECQADGKMKFVAEVKP